MIFQRIKDFFRIGRLLGVGRSSSWPVIRREHLRLNNTCAVCGGSKKCEVHHKLPFHIHPELELDPNNLITLCESGKNGVSCHLFVGHLGSYKSWNANVDGDAKIWNDKLINRPKN